MVLYLTEDIIEEAISGQEVVDALNDRIGVLITYNDETSTAHQGKRYIEPYVYGLTKAGNPCIRAYQYIGDTKRGVPKWKLFRLDRITSWEATGQKFDIEPKARGWAAQAYNDNGDGSMSAVYQTVQLDAEPLTDYERLKADTRRIKSSKPLTIDQFKDRLQYPEERKKEQQVQQTQEPQQQTQAGPVNAEKPKQQYQAPIQEPKNTESKPLDGRGNVETSDAQRPMQQEPNQTGPVVNKPKVDAQQSTAAELMSNDDFQKMLKRNLEISAQEKAKRDAKRNLKNPQKH